MSLCAVFKSDLQLEPKNFFDALQPYQLPLYVTSAEFPSVHFGIAGEALRGIEINREEEGYVVRVCYYASDADYRLFALTVKAAAALLNVAPLWDDYTEGEPVDVDEIDTDSWRDKQHQASLSCFCFLTNYYGKAGVMDGLLQTFCVGMHMYEHFKVDVDSDNLDNFRELLDYLVSVQWYLKDKQATSTRILIQSPDGDHNNDKRVSLFALEDPNFAGDQYIAYAPLVAFHTAQDKELLLVPIEHLGEILPAEKVRIIDEYQYELLEPFTKNEIRETKQRARLFTPSDVFHKPLFPGKGFDEQQRTFILTWNPSISSITLDEHRYALAHPLTYQFNWSVCDYKNVRIGDRFFMIKVGDWEGGVVMSGIFTSLPYRGEDWSGKGRETFYVNMQPNIIIDPENAPTLSTYVLNKQLAGFKWDGGASGRLLDQELARKLEVFWKAHLCCNRNLLQSPHAWMLRSEVDEEDDCECQYKAKAE